MEIIMNAVVDQYATLLEKIGSAIQGLLAMYPAEMLPASQTKIFVEKTEDA